MDNKLSELSKPAAYKFDHGVMGPGDFKYGTPQMHSAAKDENASPLYSQEYVSALLARIAEFEAEEARRKLIRDTWNNIPAWKPLKHSGRGA
ncbi:hypothetical protein [Serratia plymuthica]|uniref:hypothetical protein n=1 Tax=Serratia plymuthica TaxID=82996 RepID=UPI0014196559|nr:hypothetical protein [Serratia plymuthica]NIC28254.1 hypothetical protein [Serratia plymuthica]